MATTTAAMSATTGSSLETIYGELGATYTAGDLRTPQKSLGQDDFLKLLVTQMTTQDPLSPKGDLDFIGQMASFTSLEQTRAMIADLSVLRSDQEILKANALIGRTVEIDLGDGKSSFGVVSEVRVEEGTPKVLVGGKAYELDQLRSITLPGYPA